MTITRRGLLTTGAGVGLAALAGCLQQQFKEENVIFSSEIEDVTHTDEGVKITTELRSKFSCSNSDVAERATIGISILVDGEVAKEDTWEVKYTGCMDEVKAARIYTIDVVEYDTLSIEYEVLSAERKN